MEVIRGGVRNAVDRLKLTTFTASLSLGLLQPRSTETSEPPIRFEVWLASTIKRRGVQGEGRFCTILDGTAKVWAVEVCVWLCFLIGGAGLHRDSRPSPVPMLGVLILSLTFAWSAAELKLPMDAGQRHCHVFPSHDESKGALRGALTDGNDIHVLPAQGGETTAGDSRNRVQLLTDNRDDAGVFVDSNVFARPGVKVMGKFMAQGFHRFPGDCRCDNQAQAVLRGGLRDQEHIGANRCGGSQGT